MMIYNAAVRATKRGFAHNPRSWDNLYSPQSWVVTIGKVDVLMYEDSSAHFQGPSGGTVHISICPIRLRRALRRAGVWFNVGPSLAQQMFHLPDAEYGEVQP